MMVRIEGFEPPLNRYERLVLTIGRNARITFERGYTLYPFKSS